MTFIKQLELHLDRILGSSADKRQRADACGLDYNYYVMIASGSKNPPSDEKVLEVANKLGLSNSEAVKLMTLSIKDKAKDPATKNILEKALSSHPESSSATSTTTPIDLPRTDYYTVPVWSSVQAGTGQLSEQTAEVVDEVLLAAEEYKVKCFALQITGSSMEPDIRDGDIGIFEPPNGLQPSENDIVIVELEGHGQWMIKRLKINGPSKIELISSNQDNPPIRVNLDTEKIEIKGILLRTVRKFKKRLFLK